MKRLDFVALLVIFVTILLLSVVIFVGNRIPIVISCQFPTPCTNMSPYGSVVFEFSRPVQVGLVEKLWQTVPLVEGKWEWLDEQHVRWNSTNPLRSGQKVTLQFSPGQVGQNGEQIRTIGRWEVTVRPPRIIVSQNEGGGQDLFSYELEEGVPGKQVSHTNGRVYDYRTSPDGETIIFSEANDLNGIDLWIVQRDGSNQRKLLECGADRCSTPAFSPTLDELAYTREGAGLDPNGPKGVPRIWILDMQSGQTAPLFTDLQKIGYGPNWSPDGQWLSIWNGSQGGIQVVNRKSGDTFLLESSNGDPGTWTQNSKYLYYANTVLGETGFHNVVLRADIRNQTISTVLGGNVEGGGLSVNNPVTSPSDPWVAVTIQENVQIPGRELFLLFPDSKDGISISDDLSRIPGFYSWTPDGHRLVYQMDVLGGKETNAEIWVWDQKKGKSTRITTAGRAPQWLP